MKAPAEIKFPCPLCGQKIACEESASGANVNCPKCQAAVIIPGAKEWQAIQPQDVFIIYRAEIGDAEYLAGLVREGLQKRGFEVFADDEGIRSGRLSVTSLKKIELATDVVVLFTGGIFEGCENEGDHVRREIAYALSLGRNNITPMLDRHHKAPAALPVEIAGVLSCHGVRAEPEVWEGSMNHLAGLLKSRTSAPARLAKRELKKARPLAMLAAATAALGIGLAIMALQGPNLNYFAFHGWTNLATITKVTAAVVAGLDGLLLVGAVLTYGLLATGLKLLNSSASTLVLASTACSVAFFAASRTYVNAPMSGSVTEIWMITIVPLIVINKLATNRLRTIAKDA